MRAIGRTTIDFGAFPGSAHVSVNVATPTVEVGSEVEAWLTPVATADHSADEHVVDGPIVSGHINSPGVGITIHGRASLCIEDRVNRGPDPMPYGLWTVSWVHT